jgi:peptidyl-prolyl cis-trans isomerase SurA
LDYITDNQRKIRFGSFNVILDKHYAAFVEQQVIEYGLAKRYPDFGYLKQEYNDGILLFALTERVVWDKATEDTAGLRQYYLDHIGQHSSDVPRVHWIKFTASNKKIAKYVYKLAKSGLRDNALVDSITASRNYIFDKLYGPTEAERQAMKDNPQDFPITFFVTQERGKFTQPGEKPFLDVHMPWTAGTRKPVMVLDSVMMKTIAGEDSLVVRTKYNIVRINEVYPPGPKLLEESKGYYIADYQDELEKKWIGELRRKYPVHVDESVLKTLLSQN